MKHVVWSDGWADLTDRLTHARHMRIVRVLTKARSVDPADRWEFAGTVTVAHLAAWSIGEIDPVTGPPIESLDPLPQDAVQALADAATDIWTGRADPNATGAPSESG